MFAPLEGLSAAENTLEMTEDDLAYLRQYLNGAYLSEASIAQVRARFVEESHITLSKYLASGFATKLRNAIRISEASSVATATVPDHAACLADGEWSVRGPPHRQRFLVPNGQNSTPALQLLEELRALCIHPAFRKWLTAVTTLTLTSYHITPRRFRPGLDYTLATSSETPTLELELGLTPSAGWNDGESGGWEAFMPSGDESQEDPAVYAAAKVQDGEDDEDEGGALLTTYPAWSQLTLVLRDPGLLNFTKYVSVRAGESRWDVRGSFAFLATDSDEEDEEDEA